MAETTTTRPARTRRATTAKTTPAKAVKAAPKAVEPEATEEVESFVLDLVQLDDTKSYAVFTPPTGSGCVGKLYVPLGCTEVRVKITGPKS